MEKNKKIILLVIIAAGIIAAAIYFLGSSQNIADIKNEEHLGEQVKVSGTVTSVIKLGELSGYELTDKNGDKIGVSIKKLPQEGDRVTAKGTLMKEILIGYYILIKE